MKKSRRPLKRRSIKHLATVLEHKLQAFGQTKLWLVASTVALMTFYSGSDFVAGFRDWIADRQQRELVEIQRKQDVERHSIIRDEIKQCFPVIRQAMNNLEAVQDTIKYIGPARWRFETDKARDALDHCRKGRVVIGEALAAIRGLTLQTPEYADFYKGLDSDLEEVLTAFSGYEDYYTTILRGQQINFNDTVGRLARVQLNLDETLISIHRRGSTLQPKLEHIEASLALEKSKQKQKTVFLVLKGILFFFLTTSTVLLFVLLLKNRPSDDTSISAAS